DRHQRGDRRRRAVFGLARRVVSHRRDDHRTRRAGHHGIARMSRPTDRDVFLPVGAQPSIDALCEQAERAEELGYDRVWLPETWGRDAVTVLTSIAHRTDEIGIGTSI